MLQENQHLRNVNKAWHRQNAALARELKNETKSKMQLEHRRRRELERCLFQSLNCARIKPGHTREVTSKCAEALSGEPGELRPPASKPGQDNHRYRFEEEDGQICAEEATSPPQASSTSSKPKPWPPQIVDFVSTRRTVSRRNDRRSSLLPSTTVDQTADSGREGSRALSPTQEGQKRVHFPPPAMSAHAVLHADPPPTTTAAGQKRRDTGTRDHVEDEILGAQSSNELDECSTETENPATPPSAKVPPRTSAPQPPGTASPLLALRGVSPPISPPHLSLPPPRDTRGTSQKSSDLREIASVSGHGDPAQEQGPSVQSEKASSQRVTARAQPSSTSVPARSTIASVPTGKSRQRSERPRRAVSRPLSYQEPSLNVKMRKGHVMFPAAKLAASMDKENNDKEGGRGVDQIP